MTAPYVEVKIPAATCDDDAQPADVEVTASIGEFDGILLAIAVPGTAYEAVELTTEAAQQLRSTLADAIAHLTQVPADASTRDHEARMVAAPQPSQDRALTWCTADPATIRAWLTSPDVDGDEPGATVADQLGIDEHFGVDDPDANLHLARLFEASQAAGVFGVSGRTVELWHVADDEGALDGHLIVARSGDDSGLASSHIPVDLLIDADRTGVEAALSTLENAAVTVNELLAADPAAPQAPTAARADRPTQSPAARAFPALDVATGAAAIGAAAASPPVTATAAHRRSR